MAALTTAPAPAAVSVAVPARPRLLPPRPTTETVRPELPSLRMSMTTTLRPFRTSASKSMPRCRDHVGPQEDPERDSKGLLVGFRPSRFDASVNAPTQARHPAPP